MTETLLCSKCDLEWSRESKRGRKPSMCPSCSAPQKTHKAKAPQISIDDAIDGKSIYCSHRMHVICAGEAKKFEKYLSCGCSCHKK